MSVTRATPPCGRRGSWPELRSPLAARCCCRPAEVSRAGGWCRAHHAQPPTGHGGSGALPPRGGAAPRWWRPLRAHVVPRCLLCHRPCVTVLDRRTTRSWCSRRMTTRRWRQGGGPWHARTRAHTHRLHGPIVLRVYRSYSPHVGADGRAVPLYSPGNAPDECLPPPPDNVRLRPARRSRNYALWRALGVACAFMLLGRHTHGARRCLGTPCRRPMTKTRKCCCSAAGGVTLAT